MHANRGRTLLGEAAPADPIVARDGRAARPPGGSGNGAMARHARLVDRLRRQLQASTGGRVALIQTHISSVLLAGDFAYKLKKPVAFGFVDFSTLAARRHCCEEELRLNRRTAPQIYLDVVRITGTEEAPRLNVRGAPIDYAVRMRRFAGRDLADRRARAGRFSAAHADRLAAAVAAFHQAAAPAPPGAGFGAPAKVLRWARENFALALLRLDDEAQRARLQRLADWTEGEFRRREAWFALRAAAGFIREGHGDLHLANIVLLDGVPVPFDGIEFNAELRFIDVASDVAFAFMDLVEHGLSPLAWRFLDRYLQATGDYGLLPGLRFYAVYRALVRAKVSLIRAHQPDARPAERQKASAAFARDLALAERLARPAKTMLVAIGGLSGSGKTTVADRLLEGLGAVRVRSDVERKRLAAVSAGTRVAAGYGAGLYAPAMTARTYERLRQVADLALDAGHPVIVDAALLARSEREALREVAARHGVRFVLLWCEAPWATLRSRVARRERRGRDASDATVAVLQRQREAAELPAADEHALPFDTAVGRTRLDAEVAALAARLRGCEEIVASGPRSHRAADPYRGVRRAAQVRDRDAQ
jgi:aminoglycoside phosphotransferase family enzyme/predicted kinase